MAWIRISGDSSLQHGTHGRHGFAGSRTEVTDGGEESGPDVAVGVAQAGRQLLQRCPERRGRICPSARAAPRRTRGSGALTACVSRPTTGRPIWASASAI